MTVAPTSKLASWRAWLALGYFVLTCFLFVPIETALHHPLAQAFNLHMIRAVAMAPVPYGVLMIARLVLDLLHLTSGSG